jgi:hypothetical protein
MRDVIVLAVLVLTVGISLSLAHPGAARAGGYLLTDKEGKVISEDKEHVITIGPTDNAIVLVDRGDRKIFELTWDAGAQSLVIKGDRTHLKVHRDGTVERWAAFPEGQVQPPVLIQPIVPYAPQAPQQ